MSLPAPIVVELYGQPGCCLCDEARVVLLALRDALGFELRERDITTDDALLRAQLERIPVVLVAGEEVSHLGLDEAELRLRLAEPSAGSFKVSQ